MRLVSFFFLTFIIQFCVQANEGGGGGGEHGGGGAPAVEADYSGKQSQEWSEVQTKLSALKSKVEAQEAVVKSLIAETGGRHGGGSSSGGAHETPPPAGGHGGGGAGGMNERIEQLKKEHQKLQALIADYNKMNTSYETRFPEKGLKESRIYRRTDPQALQINESASNYEEKVQQLQSKIMRQYPQTAKTLQAKKQKKKLITPAHEDEKGHSEKKLNPATNKSGDVTEQIILKK